ncbi:unnamed protein product [Heligmosomoides polygyrus]|uniref:Ovule protein n=1 Tax=Heligmosomoides polygyrus TaxID=6339 RepID=A0A183FRT9_HELPZ|nr:unnamed protein product [Heligmosomoides polygyrus]
MVFIQVELKHHAQVQDLVGFLLSRSYNNFRVAEQDMFLPGFANFSAMQMTPTMASTMSKDSASSSHAECPILDSQGELDMSPMSFASRLMAQKPICMEILEDDDNDLSIDNPNESGEKAVEKHKLKADVVKSKEKQIVEEIGE